MEMLNFEQLRESFISFSSIMSIVGMTVAMFGVKHEKNSVASFRI